MNKVIALGQGLALLACAIALPLHAAVPADQAQRLKGDLTPTGAEKGGECRRLDSRMDRWTDQANPGRRAGRAAR